MYKLKLKGKYLLLQPRTVNLLRNAGNSLLEG